MQKQDLIEIKIEDMLDDGRCFARVDGLAIFVSGGVYGDIVKAEVTKVKKSFAEAKILEVVKPSKCRIKNDCEYMDRCGGCTLRELRYDEQLLLKKKNVISKIERIAGIENPKVNDVIGAETKNSYRNKAVFAVGKCGEVGFMKAKSNHVLDIYNCRIQKDTAMVCAEALRKYEKNLDSNSNIKKMTVKTAIGTGEVMVCLESDVLKIPRAEELINMLDDAVYEVGASLESVAIIMSGRGKSEKDVKVEIIAGKRTIKDKIVRTDGRIIEFEISPLSFYQVNSEQMIKLYDKAMEYAGLTGKETLLDIYCGVGTIGIYMADKAARVIGIESVKQAVIDANRNSVINGIINTRYVCGKAEDVLPDLFSTADSAYSKITEAHLRDDLLLHNKTVAILDPPRSGCDSALLDALIENKVDKIVYVSCDPGTLARDIKILSEGGYDFVEATPVDMFPYTSSIESVALLCRKDIDNHIEVKSHLDEEDVTKAERKEVQF